MKPTRDTPVCRFMADIYQNSQKSGCKSVHCQSHALQTGINFAIEHGFTFEIGDFAHLRACKIMWITESHYGLACKNQHGTNPSACRDLEWYFDRRPFLVKVRRFEDSKGTPKRIYVGYRFEWRGELVTCTSFAADQQSITACSYYTHEEKLIRRDVVASLSSLRAMDTEQMGDSGRNPNISQIKKRYKITHADLAGAVKGQKELNL